MANTTKEDKKDPTATAAPQPAPTEATAANSATTPTSAAPVKKKSHLGLWIGLGIGAFVLLFVVPAVMFVVGVSMFGTRLGKAVNVNGTSVDGSGKVSVQDKNGNSFSAGGNQTLPKDLPSSVVIYKGSILSSGRLTTDGKTGWSVVVATNDSLDTVGSSLSNSYSSNGWSTVMDNKSSDGGLLVAKNGNLQANIYYSTKDGKTNIVYTVAEGAAN